MGKWRADWQKLKKEFPQFAEFRGDKLGLGPLMDEHEKYCAGIVKDMEKLEKALLAWSNSREKLRASYKLYEKVAADLVKTDKSIEGDFHDVWKTPKNMSLPYYLQKTFLPRTVRI